MSQLDRISEALAAYDRGWWLTPLKGKRPILQGWSEQPKPSREDVIAWATAGNVGVRMGVVRRADGLVLVGVDVDPGAPDEFLQAHQTIPTLWARTPRGGLHGYFWGPPGLRNSASRLAPHVDIRARGGQCVCVGADGYSWITEHEIAELPHEWLDKLGSAGKLARAAGVVAAAPEGTRNDTLNREAWKLRADIAAGRIAEADVRARMSSASTLPTPEIHRTLDSALSVRVTAGERRILAPGIHAGNLVSTSADFTRLVLQAIPQDRLYLRAGTLGEIVDGRWAPILPHRLRGIADEFVEVKWLKDKGERGVIEENGHMSDEHAKLVLANAASSGVPRVLRALCPHPVIGRDMSVLGPGWHAAHGLLVHNCEIAATAANPLDLARDFPIDEVSKANLLALLVTLLIRPALGGGNVPLFISTAPQPRVGKSYMLHAIVGGIAFGGPLPSDVWPEDPDEVRKLLLAALIGGGEVYMIDNVPRRLDSAALASFVTAPKQGGRILGASKWVEMDNTLTVLANGNHVEASEELARRAVVIEFEPIQEEPDQRTGFAYADLQDAALTMRASALRWLVDLAENAAAGSKLVLGGFERWGLATGRLLHAYPVLQNRKKHIQAMVAEDLDVEPVVAAMGQLVGEEWLRLYEIMAIANGLQWGGEALDPGRSERSRLTNLGGILRKHVGRIYNGLRLQRRKFQGDIQWRVVRVH